MKATLTCLQVEVVDEAEIDKVNILQVQCCVTQFVGVTESILMAV